MDGTEITPTRAPFAATCRGRRLRWRRRSVRFAERSSGCGWRSAARIRWSEPTTLALIAVLILSAYFVLFPGVDLVVSEAFYRAGDGFFLSQEPVLRALRKSSTYVMVLILLTALAGLGMRLFGANERRTMCARRCGFLLIGLALGPGLVVNTWLKGSWGRARPIQTDLFGGKAGFTPAWTLSEACAHNCSFVSGEAASAAWMVAGLILLPRAWRAKAAAPLIAYAVALSMNRLAFGGHYLSDILLSWAITGLVLAVLHRVMVACPYAARQARTTAFATA
jgi:lipid A 4'-phosphatase